jgi:hypothetical protein
MKQEQIDYDSIKTDAAAHIDKTQAQVPRGTPLPTLDHTLPLARRRWSTPQRNRIATRRQRLLDALEAVATDAPTAAQAWEVLWNDTAQRAFYSVHYRTRPQRGTIVGTLHTVPGIANTQEREDLTCLTLETLFRGLPRWRALPPNERLAWYFRQQRWQHVSWYRRLRMESNRGAGPRHPAGEAAAVPEDMPAVAQALCAASAAAERPQSLRLEPVGAASAAYVSALLQLRHHTLETAPPLHEREAWLQPAIQYEVRDLGSKAVALLQALSISPHGSKVLREGSLAILRTCANEGLIGELGQELSSALQAQHRHVPAGTRRSQIHTTRAHVKAQLDCPDPPSHTPQRRRGAGKPPSIIER